MIEINLLPEQMRRVEGTPLPRLLTICLGVAVALLLIFVNASYYMEIDKRTKARDELQAEVDDLTTRAKELDEIEAKIQAIGARVHAAEELFRNRVVFAKLLADLKRTVNEQGFERANEDREYLWFSHLSLEEARGGAGGAGGPKRFLTLEGYASAAGANTRRAIQMMNNLMRTILEYEPRATPEEENRAERLAQLRERVAALRERLAVLEGDDALDQQERQEYEALKKEAGALENQIAHLEAHRSGLIAGKPLYDTYFSQEAEGRQIEYEWEDSLSGGGRRDGAPLLPNAAMKFEFKLGFKPRVKPDAGPKTF